MQESPFWTHAHTYTHTLPVAVAPLVQGTSIAELQKHSSKENVFFTTTNVLSVQCLHNQFYYATVVAPNDVTLIIICVVDFFWQVTGRVNYDIWKHAVGYTIDDLRIKDEFPNHPDVSYYFSCSLLFYMLFYIAVVIVVIVTVLLLAVLELTMAAL